jgi:hypothetical protein
VTNSFEKHGIKHLSPSTINTFAAQPALFVMEKLLKRRGPVGCSAHRGTAAEAGIVMGLLDHSASIEACQAHAAREYDRLTALSGDPKREKERDAVPGIVASGINELRQYGVPSGVQVRIERTLPGVPVPWLGFADLVYDQHGLTVDIKTSLKLASDISLSHARQFALYIYGTNHSARGAYFTPSKRGVYLLQDADKRIADLINIAQRMERFLSVSDDPKFLASIVVPDVDSFYYSDPTTRGAVREVFGL